MFNFETFIMGMLAGGIISISTALLAVQILIRKQDREDEKRALIKRIANLEEKVRDHETS